MAKQVTGDMTAVIICEKFGWDWYQYQAAPQEFIDLIVAKMQIDAQ